MEMRAESDTSWPREVAGDDGPVVLESPSFYLAGAAVLLLIGLIWNGMLGMWLWGFLAMGQGPGWQIGWFGILFAVPFVLVGLGMWLAAIYLLLASFNPKPVIVCSERNLYPGQETELSWFFQGGVDRIRRLEIVVEGRERVQYREGTKLRTEQRLLCALSICDAEQPEQIARGFRLIQLPWGAMHTFEGANNQIRWRVLVRGDIRWWPDVLRTFPIQVLPPPLPGPVELG